MKHFSKSAWLPRRLDMLERKAIGRVGVTTNEVRDTLKIATIQLLRWTKDPYFVHNKIAIKDGSHWVWIPERLRTWIAAVSRERVRLNPPAWERAVKRNPPGDENDFYYHVTNEQNAADIAADGFLDVHAPDYGTDQDMWPDGSTQDRSYFVANPDHAWKFAPEEGKAVMLRIPKTAAKFKRESTGDIYATKKIPAEFCEIQYPGKPEWTPLVASNPPAPVNDEHAEARRKLNMPGDYIVTTKGYANE